MQRILFCLIATVLVLGCAGKHNDTNRPDEQPTPDLDATTELFTDLTIDIEGTKRSYHLYLPGEPKTAPLVLLLHGNRGSSDQLLGLNGLVAPFKRWLTIAERENLVLIIPNGETSSEGHQGWNDCRTDVVFDLETDDVFFLRTLIDSVSNMTENTDPRVFSVGISNGGLMTMRLADEIPNQLDGIAIVVASRPVNTECPDSSTPVSALFMNGTDDPILPYEGGHIVPMRGELFSTLDTVAYWVNRNQANTSTETLELPDLYLEDNSVVRVTSYSGGLNDTKIKHYEVVGGGHTEPSLAEHYSNIYKLVVGEQNRDIEMADEIWDFFSTL